VSITVHFAPQSISWFKDRAAEDHLVFKPPFQRNPVWLPKHKAFLIDTILRGLPVPEVYLEKATDEAGETIFQVVDGQQRLRTLLEFPRGNVELMEQYSPGRDGQTWDDLSKDERVAYWSYRLVVREIESATDADLRDLFRRLNQHTVVLNAQELRNARFSGEFISAVTGLADQDYWAEQRVVSTNEIRRMLDIEYMAELLIGLMHGPQKKKENLDTFFDSYDETFPKKHKWLTLFETARALIEELLPDLRGTRWRGKSDFYSLFLACAHLSNEGKLDTKAKKALSRRLIEFGDLVTSRLSKESKEARFPKEVRSYADAVEKAASDKDRRQERHRILLGLLSE
jgi:Protein of unknown function DUF262